MSHAIRCPCCTSEHDGDKRHIKKLEHEWRDHFDIEKFKELAVNMLAVLNSSDSEHADFLDSGADTIDLLWRHEKEIRRLATSAENKTS